MFLIQGTAQLYFRFNTDKSWVPPDSPNKVKLDNCCNTYLFSLPSWRTLKQTQLSMNLLKPCQGQIAILVHLVLVAEG